jgi:hypothetical protein
VRFIRDKVGNATRQAPSRFLTPFLYNTHV